MIKKIIIILLLLVLFVTGIILTKKQEVEADLEEPIIIVGESDPLSLEGEKHM